MNNTAINNTAFAKEKARPGYKKTKLGWIPQEWSILEFDEIAIRSKSTYSNKKDNQSYKCIELEHINQNVGSINGYANSLAQKSTKTRFKSGHILFGKLRPYLKKFWLADFNGVCSTEIWVLDRREGMTENKFLFYLIQSNRFIQAANATSGSKMPRADWWYVSKFPFILPPLPEQQKIANILNTWDKAIAAQEQLIAQKQALKKGLMQALLTGKKRFDGFTEEWEEVKLKEVFTLSSGKTKPKNTYEKPSTKHSIPVYGGNGISGYTDSIFSKGKVILIGRVGEYCGVVHYVDNDIWITDNCLYTKSFSKKDNILFFAFLLEYYKLDRLRNKGGQPLVSQKPILNFKLKKPKLEEQKKIADVLSSKNKEIDILKEKVEHLKTQKQGLMQQLLTGEKRVKI